MPLLRLYSPHFMNPCKAFIAEHLEARIARSPAAAQVPRSLQSEQDMQIQASDIAQRLIAVTEQSYRTAISKPKIPLEEAVIAATRDFINRSSAETANRGASVFHRERRSSKLMSNLFRRDPSRSSLYPARHCLASALRCADWLGSDDVLADLSRLPGLPKP